MNNITNIFKQITSIPRCSGTHDEFIQFTRTYSKKYGYECFIDDAKNILCKKKNSKSKICLQSHYDIVCLVDNTIPQIIEDENYYRAKNSTLGSDNGIGCSYMLDLMEKGYDLEYLFTSDEEIGLIGANNINLEINSPFMLNLDSEAEGEICIGCAGGVDIIATYSKNKLCPNIDKLYLYEIELLKLPGGHSGVNIHQNIPNAIKLLAKTIKECDGKVLDFNAGERINSIPANAKAIIASSIQPQASHENMKITKVKDIPEHFNLYGDDLVNFIYNFKNGVIENSTELNVVETSINIAICETKINEIEIQLSARSMDNNKLNKIKNETVNNLLALGFKVETNGKYPAWKPDINEFTKKVLEIYKKHNSNAKLEAIHAGLECAIFKEKFSHLKIASIGPDIFNPHSYDEKVSKVSINNLSKIVEDIINEI